MVSDSEDEYSGSEVCLYKKVNSGVVSLNNGDGIFTSIRSVQALKGTSLGF